MRLESEEIDMKYDETELLENMRKNLNKMMQEQKITVSDLSERTGVSTYEIRNIKEGKIKRLNAKNIVKLAFYFQVTPNEFLGAKELPEELEIDVSHVEFQTSFYEKEGLDFTFYNKCDLLDSYDPEFEKCVVNCIHSFVEAHKLAAGYYYEKIDREETRQLSGMNIDDNYKNYVIEKIFRKYDGNSEDEEDKVPFCDKIDEISNSEQIGKTIKKMREMYNITRKELSERTGLGIDCLYRIENGQNKKINYSHINIIARELLCTADFLLGESCDPTADKSGKTQFYIGKDLIFRYVELGHDLAYVKNYMDEENKEIVIKLINQLNLLYKLYDMNKGKMGKRLDNQDVYFREQKHYKNNYKNRGAHFYTKKYFKE